MSEPPAPSDGMYDNSEANTMPPLRHNNSMYATAETFSERPELPHPTTGSNDTYDNAEFSPPTESDYATAEGIGLPSGLQSD